MKVLILSSEDDQHAKVVREILVGMNAEVDFLRLDQFIEGCAFAYQIGWEKNSSHVDKENANLDLNSYFSIWYRRPGTVRSTSFAEPWIERMVENEARSALDGIFRSLNCLWMNLPANNLACSNKLWQLQMAKKLGFSIPETLVTNKPQLVQEFFDQCDGHVIYKLMGEQTNLLIPPNENPRGVSTMPLRKEDLPFLGQVALAPHMFQRYIQKAYDLRITVVGEEIFCTRIDSQSGHGKIDWRHDYNVGMEAFQLPDELVKMSFALTRNLGLNYGSIDLVLTSDGEYIFLEINCGGQYLWVEDRTKQQISLAVARFLVGDLEPLVKPVRA
jgi:glutathione synthase/RimK-type ligase-like ATP-grasp enzyme